jgi:succinyl-diaminopimelate desuccinylase
MEIEIANLTLKHLLMIRFYADPVFARAFRYDHEDISRARRNEELTARNGLRSEIENPFTGKPIPMRQFLEWTLQEVRPLGEALGLWSDLAPLCEMARGAPNTAERIRRRLLAELGDSNEVPIELLRELVFERRERVSHDVEQIAELYPALQGEAAKLGEFIQHARDDVHQDIQVPIRFRPRPEAMVEVSYPDKTSEVLALAQTLIRIPSVTACPEERLEDVRLAATFIFDYVRNHGLEVRYYDQYKYPALLIGFPEQLKAPVMLSGHFDVVPPEPDDSQFEPRIDGDYLWGRGAADMKTVVATNLVWMKDRKKHGPPYPQMNLLLVGNEENGEMEAMGTPFALRLLSEEDSYAPQLLIAGERTGEKGSEQYGEIFIQNRGVMRFVVAARGQRGHSGVASAQADLTERLFQARAAINEILGRNLTLSSSDGWQSQARFPFIQVGTPGVYNVTADRGVLGVEVRPIPQDDIAKLEAELEAYCTGQDLELEISVMENGVACDPGNKYLEALIRSVRQASAGEPVLGRKLPGTSARFAPGGQGVVWGQTGLGPHSKAERHFIPSIMPYYGCLEAFAGNLKPM